MKRLLLVIIFFYYFTDEMWCKMSDFSGLPKISMHSDFKTFKNVGVRKTKSYQNSYCFKIFTLIFLILKRPRGHTVNVIFWGFWGYDRSIKVFLPFHGRFLEHFCLKTLLKNLSSTKKRPRTVNERRNFIKNSKLVFKLLNSLTLKS